MTIINHGIRTTAAGSIVTICRQINNINPCKVNEAFREIDKNIAKVLVEHANSRCMVIQLRIDDALDAYKDPLKNSLMICHVRGICAD